jgi:regulator of protease activity HflC (stomatin/prohibitin superfamily)
MNKRIRLLLLALVLAVFSSACYFNDEVATNQVAVKLDRNEIDKVVGPGVYSDWGFFSDLRELDVDTLTFSVDDPEVLTSDNQSVGVKITIQARRKSDEDSVKNIFTRWNSLTDNEALKNTISATAREGMKNGTRGFTLTQLLDDRTGLADAIRTQLELDAEKYSVEIVNVTIENIGPSAEYMSILSQTANIKAQTDQEIRRQDLINQKAKNSILEQEKRVEVANAQVVAEQAETSVQVEIATRQGKIIAASNQVYADNPQAYQLRRLELLKEVLGEKTVIYLPSDVVLNLLQNFGDNTVLPLPLAESPVTP